MGSESTTKLLESEMGSSDNTMSNNNNNNKSSLWAPGSPRFSFSRDFVQSEVFNPSTSSTESGDTDFDFGMFALLRSDTPGSATPVLPAHQLIHNGKILLQDERVESDHSTALRRDSPSKSRHSDKRPKPAAPSRSWKDLFPLNFKRSSASSASSAATSSASAETVPLNAACGASLREKTSSKLRFLFRSSSAGSGGTRDQSLEAEPSLGRSASESKVSSSSCDPFQIPDRNAATQAGVVAPSALHRRTGSTADAYMGQISSDTWKIPRERIRHRSFSGRPVLAEVTMGGGVRSPGNGSPNFQPFNNSNNNNDVKNGVNKNTIGKPKCWSNKKMVSSANSSSNNNNNNNSSSSSRSGGKSSSSNAWRAYMSSANRNTGNMKVAEVLHMEVCMGQSISKAFSMRKENEILQAPRLHNNSKSSSRSNPPDFSLARLPRRVSCQSQSIEQM